MGVGVGAQQNRVTPSPQTFDFALWTLDLDLDCDNQATFLLLITSMQECQKCEKYEDIEIDIEYEQNCHRQQKNQCRTEYKEVSEKHFISI